VELAVFALFAALALVSAIVVVSHRNPVYSVLSLVVTLVSLAALFVLLGAPFLAALQVLVYTGAILVLFLFVIMLLNVGREEASREGSGRLQKIGAVLATLLFGGLLGSLLWGRFVGFSLAPLTEETVAVRPLAAALMSRYLLPFEMTGLLLLAAVVAATVLAQRPTPRSGPGRGGRS
jgi:NADH-quinone oxidoreductase subunit J